MLETNEIKTAEFEDDGLEDLESNFLENKVDVDKYINLAIFYCLKSLTNPLGNDVLVIYACAVENLENMCDGAKYLSDEYFEKVKKVKETEGWGVMPDSPIQRFRLATKKFNFIICELRGNKAIQRSFKV